VGAGPRRQSEDLEFLAYHEDELVVPLTVDSVVATKPTTRFAVFLAQAADRRDFARLPGQPRHGSGRQSGKHKAFRQLLIDTSCGQEATSA
jgi:hypothetical protein